MKKTLIILILVPVLLFTGCFLFKDDAQTIVQNELGLDISAANINFFLNTRKDNGGGITVIEAAFSDGSFAGQLEGKDGFKALPLSETLTEILNSIDLLKGEDGKLLIPYADNGYYQVKLTLDDKGNENLTAEKSADLLIAIFDGDTNKFHYCHAGIDNINVLSKLQGLIDNS